MFSKPPSRSLPPPKQITSLRETQQLSGRWALYEHMFQMSAVYTLWPRRWVCIPWGKASRRQQQQQETQASVLFVQLFSRE